MRAVRGSQPRQVQVKIHEVISGGINGLGLASS